MGKSTYTIRRSSRTMTLHNADCITGMLEQIRNRSIDLIVTSPPYNLGTQYTSYKDDIPRLDYLDWIEEWAGAVDQVLSDSGSLFLNIGAKPSDPTVPFQVLSRVQKYFSLQNVIHWVKSIAIQQEDIGNYPTVTGNIAVGHFKPINSPRFVNDCHEYIFHLTKSQNVPLDRLSIGVEYQDKSNVKRWKSGKDRRCRGNTWFVPYKTISRRAAQRPHPATFPVKIPKMCIQLHGADRVKRVLDPFLGIGTTAMACIELGINCVGYEIDPVYFQEACRMVELYEPEPIQETIPNTV